MLTDKYNLFFLNKIGCDFFRLKCAGADVTQRTGREVVFLGWHEGRSDVRLIGYSATRSVQLLFVWFKIDLGFGRRPLRICPVRSSVQNWRKEVRLASACYRHCLWAGSNGGLDHFLETRFSNSINPYDFVTVLSYKDMAPIKGFL